MREALLSTFFIFSIFTIQGQQISGQVLNATSGEPISTVAITVVGKQIGCITDENGKFELSIGNASDEEIMRFSIISHQEENFTIGDLKGRSSPIIVRLTERIIELNEVVKKGKKRIPKQLGLKRKYCYPVPLYKKVSTSVNFPQKNLINEIGVRFTNSGLVRIDSIQLNLASCEFDEISLRINVYELKNETFRNILVDPIDLEFSKEAALSFPTIDLSKNDIVLNSDFLITIENLQLDLHNFIQILASAKEIGQRYPTYYRKDNQSKWSILTSKKDKVIGLSFIAFVHK